MTFALNVTCNGHCAHEGQAGEFCIASRLSALLLPGLSAKGVVSFVMFASFQILLTCLVGLNAYQTNREGSQEGANVTQELAKNAQGGSAHD
jgi:hypothetical protein